jgi:hypothetical protein
LKHRDGVVARSHKNSVAEDGKERTEESIHRGDSHFYLCKVASKIREATVQYAEDLVRKNENWTRLELFLVMVSHPPAVDVTLGWVIQMSAGVLGLVSRFILANETTTRIAKNIRIKQKIR